jgi:hypothetical protein
VQYHAGNLSAAKKTQRHELQKNEKRSAMQIVDLIQNLFESWFVLVRFCASCPINTPACISLWVYITMASGVAGVLLLTWATLKVMRHCAAVKAEEEYASHAAMVADGESIEQHQWRGGGQSLDDAALEERIRELLAEQKLANGSITPERTGPLNI